MNENLITIEWKTVGETARTCPLWKLFSLITASSQQRKIPRAGKGYDIKIKLMSFYVKSPTLTVFMAHS